MRASLCLLGGLVAGTFFGYLVASPEQRYKVPKEMVTARAGSESVLPSERSTRTSRDHLVKNLKSELDALGITHLDDLERHLEIYDQALRSPQQVIGRLLADRTGYNNGGYVMTALTAWVRHDPANAVAGLEELSSTRNTSSWWPFVATKLAEQDPDFALETLNRQKVPPGSSSYLAVIKSLANKDLAKADRYWRSVENPQQRLMAALGVAESLSEAGRADVWLAEIEDLEFAIRIEGHLLGIEATNTPRAVLEKISKMEDVELRGRLLAIDPMLIHKLSPSNPELVMEMLLDSLTGEELYSASSRVFASLAQTDPIRAVELVDDVPEGPLRDYGFAKIAEHWSMHAPEEAFAWAASLKDEMPSSVFNQVFARFSSRNPRQALDYATSELQKSEFPIEPVFKAWADRSPEEAWAWLQENRNRDSVDSDTLLEMGLKVLSRKNPLAAIEAVRDLPDLGAETLTESVVDEAIDAMVKKDPETSIDWALRHSEAELLVGRNQDFLSDVLNRWFINDSLTASRWLKQLENSNPVRDRAIFALVDSVGEKDFSGAVAWVAVMTPGGQRQSAIERLGEIAIGMEPDQVESVSSNFKHSLSESERRILTTQIAKK